MAETFITGDLHENVTNLATIVDLAIERKRRGDKVNIISVGDLIDNSKGKEYGKNPKYFDGEVVQLANGIIKKKGLEEAVKAIQQIETMHASGQLKDLEEEKRNKIIQTYKAARQAIAQGAQEEKTLDQVTNAAEKRYVGYVPEFERAEKEGILTALISGNHDLPTPMRTKLGKVTRIVDDVPYVQLHGLKAAGIRTSQERPGYRSHPGLDDVFKELEPDFEVDSPGLTKDDPRYLAEVERLKQAGKYDVFITHKSPADSRDEYGGGIIAPQYVADINISGHFHGTKIWKKDKRIYISTGNPDNVVRMRTNDRTKKIEQIEVYSLTGQRKDAA